MSEEVTNGEMVVDVINEEGSVVPIKEQIEYFEPVGTKYSICSLSWVNSLQITNLKSSSCQGT